MTSTALEFLKVKGAEKGFFLMVEGGRIGKSDRFLPCFILEVANDAAGVFRSCQPLRTVHPRPQ